MSDRGAQQRPERRVRVAALRLREGDQPDHRHRPSRRGEPEIRAGGTRQTEPPPRSRLRAARRGRSSTTHRETSSSGELTGLVRAARCCRRPATERRAPRTGTRPSSRARRRRSRLASARCRPRGRAGARGPRARADRRRRLPAGRSGRRRRGRPTTLTDDRAGHGAFGQRQLEDGRRRAERRARSWVCADQIPRARRRRATSTPRARRPAQGRRRAAGHCLRSPRVLLVLLVLRLRLGCLDERQRDLRPLRPGAARAGIRSAHDQLSELAVLGLLRLASRCRARSWPCAARLSPARASCPSASARCTWSAGGGGGGGVLFVTVITLLSDVALPALSVTVTVTV